MSSVKIKINLVVILPKEVDKERNRGIILVRLQSLNHHHRILRW